MAYNLEIQKLLLAIRNLNPEDRIKSLKQAIQIADSHNDIDWGFDLRLKLIGEEKNTSHCNESFPAFAWILDVSDKNPDYFDESDFLWEYKWMLGSARRNSNISMEQIEHIAEDYKVRLLRNGYSLRPYYTSKVHLGFFLGNWEDSKKYIDLRNKELRDDMANCQACEKDDDVDLYIALNQLEKAETVGSELLNKKLTCAHMPFATYCSFTYAYAKAGNKEKAQEYFLKAEGDLSDLDDDTSQIAQIGDLIYFLSSSDPEKAWDFFENYVEWNNNSEEYIDFRFSIRILPLLKQGGKRELEINSDIPWYNKSNHYHIEDIYNFYLNRAQLLANNFDKRNGSKYFNQQLKEVL